MPYLFKTLQKYKHIRKRASISAKIFVFLTFVCFEGYIYTNFKHKNGKVCKCWVQMYKDSVCITLNIDLYGCKCAFIMRTLYNSVYLPVAYLCIFAPPKAYQGEMCIYTGHICGGLL